MASAEEIWVLLVDDHDDGRELLSDFLSLRGLSVDSCASAEAALERVAARGAPAIVITDLSLGNMSGVELARRLREQGPTSSIPILALTGHRDVEDPDHLFSEVLLKPITLEALTAAVSRALAA